MYEPNMIRMKQYILHVKVTLSVIPATLQLKGASAPVATPSAILFSGLWIEHFDILFCIRCKYLQIIPFPMHVLKYPFPFPLYKFLFSHSPSNSHSHFLSCHIIPSQIPSFPIPIPGHVI